MDTSSGATTQPRRDHLVSFYERGSFLVDSVLGFLRPVFDGGQTAAMIMSPEHHAIFGAALRAEGLDVAGAVARGQLVRLDAGRTREVLTAKGRLDATTFRSLADDLPSRLEARGEHVRIFGYVVALLWQDGHRDAALELEQLWDDLASSRGFDVMCAYPMSAFDGRDGVADFRRVCACHSAITNEGYAGLAPGPFDRDRVVVLHREASDA